MLSNFLKKNPRGFTLLEVLLAITIAGIFLASALLLISEQWRGSSEMKKHLEIQYALLTAGSTVSDAIRTAQKVQWAEPGVLRILPWPDTGVFTTDLYYIEDKNADGINDLYWQHLNIPTPVASFITEWKCTEVEPGLWKIYIQANLGKQKAIWQAVVRQRTYSVTVMTKERDLQVL